MSGPSWEERLEEARRKRADELAERLKDALLSHVDNRESEKKENKAEAASLSEELNRILNDENDLSDYLNPLND